MNNKDTLKFTTNNNIKLVTSILLRPQPIYLNLERTSRSELTTSIMSKTKIWKVIFSVCAKNNSEKPSIPNKQLYGKK